MGKQFIKTFSDGESMFCTSKAPGSLGKWVSSFSVLVLGNIFAIDHSAGLQISVDNSEQARPGANI